MTPAIANATSQNLAVGYQTQINESYCGPAAVAMVSHYLAVGWSGTSTDQQKSAAYWLNTTMADGTAWQGTDREPYFQYESAYPVADVLDKQIYDKSGNTWYVAVNVSSTPTSSQESHYKSDLTFDIGASHPLVINQYSIPDYQFHWQPNGTWYHWLAVRGYSNSGANSVINDPGFSAGNNATAPSTGGKGSVTAAIGERGYIW